MSLQQQLEESEALSRSLREQIKQAMKPRKVKAQKYKIRGGLTAVEVKNYEYRKVGSTVSEANKDRVIEERRINQVLGCIVREENQVSGYVANFTDAHQCKYYLAYDYRRLKWDAGCTNMCRIYGVEYCKKETAMKLQELLNNGAGIEGMNV